MRYPKIAGLGRLAALVKNGLGCFVSNRPGNIFNGQLLVVTIKSDHRIGHRNDHHLKRIELDRNGAEIYFSPDYQNDINEKSVP